MLHPPPLGTVLPLVPLTARELQAALVLPEPESRRALLRALEYFGSSRVQVAHEGAEIRQEDGEMWEVHFGVTAGARREVVAVEQRESYPLLQAAAFSCIAEAVLLPQENGNALRREFEAWLADASAELGAIRRFRSRVPPFASPRHAAAAVATYLVYKNPGAHHVTHALTGEECERLCGILHEETTEAGVRTVLSSLEGHSDVEHLLELMDTLALWFILGEGCTVISQVRLTGGY